MASRYYPSVAILRLNMAVLGRFFELPKQSFFLLGPRGTGKTTWLRDQLPNALYVNLLRPDSYRELAARPERLRELVLGSTASRARSNTAAAGTGQRTTNSRKNGAR